MACSIGGWTLYCLPASAFAKICVNPELFPKSYSGYFVEQIPTVWALMVAPTHPTTEPKCSFISAEGAIPAVTHIEPAFHPVDEESERIRLVQFRPRSSLKIGVKYVAKCEWPEEPDQFLLDVWGAEERIWPRLEVRSKATISSPNLSIVSSKISRIRCGCRKITTMVRLVIPGVPKVFWEHGGMIKVKHEDGYVDVLKPARPDTEPDVFFAVLPARKQKKLRLVAIDGAGVAGPETELKVKRWWPRRQ